MVTVERTIVIHRPAEDVFAYVSDQTNAPRWQRGLLEVQRTTAGPIRLGSRHDVVRTFMGRRLTVSNEYTRYEPNTLVAFEWSGTTPGHASYTVEPVATESAKLIARIELSAGILAPLVAAVLRGEVAGNLRTLKGVLEASTATSGH